MDCLQVKNWSKWQSYRGDRGTPPWIKVHRRVMTSPTWVSMTDSEKGQFVSILVLAADREGMIPADPVIIQKMAMLDDPPNIKKFISLGVLTSTRRQLDADLASDWRQHDAPETETETETERPLVKSDGFDLFWKVWPNKVKKKPARKIWARLKLDPLAEQIASHVKERVSRDKQWVPDFRGESFIPHPTTFLNAAGWEDEYETEKSQAPPPPTWKPTMSFVQEMEEKYGKRIVRGMLDTTFTNETQFIQQAEILCLP